LAIRPDTERFIKEIRFECYTPTYLLRYRHQHKLYRSRLRFNLSLCAGLLMRFLSSTEVYRS